MTAAQRAAWKAVSEKNLQAAIEDMIRACDDAYTAERYVELTWARVITDQSWRV